MLEVALDRARIKQRLAAVLHSERVRRGGGDARRFPQPKMAELLDYSLRQYQRLEDPNDSSLPTWKDLERIANRLELDEAAIFGEVSPEEAVSPEDDLRGELAEVRGQLAELRRLFEERLPAAPEDHQQVV